MRELFAGIDGGGEGVSPPDRSSPQGAPVGLDVGRLLRSARRRWRLALLLAALLVGPGVLAVLRKFEPAYAAEALLEVEATQPRVAYADEEWRARSIAGFYGDYARTFLRIARTREVLDLAVGELEQQGVDWLPDGVEPGTAPDHLGARVDVSVLRDSYLMSVRFEDRDPSLVAPVVNAMAEALVAELERGREAERDRLLATLARERARLEGELAGVHAELDRLAEEVGCSVLEDHRSVYTERLVRLQEGLTKVLVERSRVEGELLAARATACVLREELPLAELETLVDQDDAVRDARVLLGRLVRDEEQRSGHLSPEHPTRQQSLARLASARGQVEATEAAARERLRGRLVREREERARELLRQAQSRLEAAVLTEERMAREVTSTGGELMRYSRTLAEAAELRARGDQLLAALGRLDERVEQVHIEAGAPSRLRVRSRGVEPRAPASDRRRLLLALVVLLSLGGGLVGATALELLGDRIRCVQDVPGPGPVEPLHLALPRLAASIERGRPRGGAVVVELDGDSRLVPELERVLDGDARGERDPQDPSSRLHRAPAPDRSAASLVLVQGGLPVVIVARRDATRRAHLVACRRRLEEAGARVLGVVLEEGA